MPPGVHHQTSEFNQLVSYFVSAIYWHCAGVVVTLTKGFTESLVVLLWYRGGMKVIRELFPVALYMMLREKGVPVGWVLTR